MQNGMAADQQRQRAHAAQTCTGPRGALQTGLNRRMLLGQAVGQSLQAAVSLSESDRPQ